MSHPAGTYMGGVRTVECLRMRSHVDPDTGCWHWRLGCSQGAPRVWLLIDGNRVAMRGRRAALHLAGRLKPGTTAIARDICRSDDCVNPDHAKAGDRAALGAWITNSGRYQLSLARKVAPFKARLVRKGRKLDLDKARAIRASSDTCLVLSERYGVAPSVISSVKRGQLWREPSPFDALLAAA
jgi:hypothetical protein